MIRGPIYGNKKQVGYNYFYTKGGVFSLGGVDYIGPYHLHQYEPYTEGEHTLYSKKLQPYYDNPIEYDYDFKAKSKTKLAYITPRPYNPILKEADYDSGYLFRYFIQKIVDQDAIVIEIQESDFNLFGKDRGINDGVYSAVVVRWKLTGPLRSQTVSNKLPSGYVIQTDLDGIIDHNQKQVFIANNSLPGLRSSIVDYAEFARPTNYNNQLPINTNELDPEKIIKDTVPFSVKKVFIKALKNYI